MARSVALVWLVTAVGILDPRYRAVGADYLGRLGLADWWMPAACAGELVLGLRIWLGPPTVFLAGLQVSAIAFFTAVLAWVDPMLLVHPFGVLTKNLPLVVLLLVHRRVMAGGWDEVAIRGLRAGMAVIWLTEGIFPKILFQQPWEVEVVRRSGLVPIDPAAFLVLLGLAQAASGVLALSGSERVVRGVLVVQALALVVLPLLVASQDPFLWLHPFGPLTKNVPILAGTVILACRPWSRSA